MSDHVHVRLNRGLGVSEQGELVEQSYCRCGSSWTTLFPVDGGDSEE